MGFNKSRNIWMQLLIASEAVEEFCSNANEGLIFNIDLKSNCYHLDIVKDMVLVNEGGCRSSGVLNLLIFYILELQTYWEVRSCWGQWASRTHLSFPFHLCWLIRLIEGGKIKLVWWFCFRKSRFSVCWLFPSINFKKEW